MALLFPDLPHPTDGRTIEEGPVTTVHKPTPPPRPPRPVVTSMGHGHYEEIVTTSRAMTTAAHPRVRLSHRTEVVSATTTPIPTVIPISQPPKPPPVRMTIYTETAMVHYTAPRVSVSTAPQIVVSTVPQLPISSPSSPSPSSSVINVEDPLE